MTEALTRLRRLLLVALLAGVAGTAVELLLLGHTESWQQVIPVALLALALLAVAWHLVRPGRAALSALRVVMWVCVISGGAGVVLHYQGNVEFELEMYPEMRGLELFQETMTGATPVLAPGTMALLGLVGLAYAFVSTQIPNRHTQSEARK
jgi:hypothetical protein